MCKSLSGNSFSYQETSRDHDDLQKKKNIDSMIFKFLRYTFSEIPSEVK